MAAIEALSFIPRSLFTRTSTLPRANGFATHCGFVNGFECVNVATGWWHTSQQRGVARCSEARVRLGAPVALGEREEEEKVVWVKRRLEEHVGIEGEVDLLTAILVRV